MSKTLTVSLLLMFHWETMFKTGFVGICIVCLHTTFHTPNFNGSVVVAIRQKSKYISCSRRLVVLHFTGKKLNRNCTFFQLSIVRHNFRDLY
jgi:hypothetical protein